ncbi:MAG TPA: hypothetical protein VD766_03415 [Solirubrobacterales bacterium]|nr:hypothetical protein [Solirubrobacterales bacterium]
MRLIAAVLAAFALAFAAGCGGDDEESTSTTSTTSGATGATGESGVAGETVSVEDVQSCLEGEGLEANVSENELIGLEGTYEHLDVPLEDLDTGAKIVVFESAEAADAEAEAADIAMGVGDTTVAGNTIWGIDFSVEEEEDPAAAIEGCVPAS